MTGLFSTMIFVNSNLKALTNKIRFIAKPSDFKYLARK